MDIRLDRAYNLIWQIVSKCDKAVPKLNESENFSSARQLENIEA